ncbi:MAG: hypothetical protein FJW27_15500 [Acidimicrobiia bacterium]|nr:hypothetical protein [Acidimicrobiia bacterium]
MGTRALLTRTRLSPFLAWFVGTCVVFSLGLAQGGPGRAMDPQSEAGSVAKGEIETIARWLSSVRGPGSKDAPVRRWSARPTGAATRVVITEYEANRRPACHVMM